LRPYLEKPFTKNRADGVAQGEGPEFKSQYHQKKNEFKASLGKVSENPISETKTKQKKAGGMVQVVEPLPSMHEDLYSVPLLQKSAY
jgi:hypothetical protein